MFNVLQHSLRGILNMFQHKYYIWYQILTSPLEDNLSCSDQDSVNLIYSAICSIYFLSMQIMCTLSTDILLPYVLPVCFLDLGHTQTVFTFASPYVLTYTLMKNLHDSCHQLRGSFDALWQRWKEPWLADMETWNWAEGMWKNTGFETKASDTDTAEGTNRGFLSKIKYKG